MEYNPLKGEFLYDVAVKLYGDLVLGVEQILLLNPTINVDAELYGTVITYNELPKRKKPVFTDVTERPLNRIWKSLELQSIYDISVQLNGSLNGLFDLFTQYQLPDNSIPVSTNFTYIESKDPISVYFRERNIKVQTDFVRALTYILREDGFYLLREDGSRFIREEYA